jgi:hypothetical protein
MGQFKPIHICMFCYDPALSLVEQSALSPTGFPNGFTLETTSNSVLLGVTDLEEEELHTFKTSAQDTRAQSATHSNHDNLHYPGIGDLISHSIMGTTATS